VYSASLVSVSPATAYQGQTLEVTITGLNTHFNQASSSISFSQASGTIISSGTVTKINDTSISTIFTIPTNASSGYYNVNLSNSVDGNLTLNNGFLIHVDSTKRLISVSPAAAIQGQTLSVIITGLNTHFNQTSSAISFSQASSSTIINSGNTTKINDTSISASFTIPANASLGNYDVNLINSLDGSLSIPNGFQVKLYAAITSVSPSSAKQGETLAVTITGLNTHFNQASSSISFSQASGTTINSGNITKIDDTSIQANFTLPLNASLGNYILNLSNSVDGNLTLNNGFMINADSTKRLVSVSPATAMQGQALSVTITGVNTHFNQSGSSISFSQASSSTVINSGTVTKINDTLISASFTIPASVSSGIYNVNLSNSLDGSLSILNGFQVLPKIALVSVSPATAKSGQTLTVTITGLNTHFNQASSSISFSQASSSTVINSGTITKINDTSINASFTIPAIASSGDYNINLSNSLDGSLTLNNGFLINSDSIKRLVSVSPATAMQGQTLAVTITGVNTHFNQASSSISFSQASSSTIINSGTITKINDTLISASFTIPTSATSGNYNVNLSNSLDGNLTLNNGFLINADSNKRLVSVSPAKAMQGQTLAVTITGLNTHFNQASSSISISQASSSTIINTETITKINDTSISASFTIPVSASLGSYNVNLNNSLDGSLSISNGFQITPKIVLVSVSPAVATQGQTLSVTITGLNTHFNRASSTSLYQTSSGTSINSDTITKISDTSIQVQFTVPINAPVGIYDLYYEDPYDGEYLKLTDGFQINVNPTIRLVSISEIRATPGQTLEVTITGANTHFNQASSTAISFSQASSSTIINSSTITKVNDTSIKASFKIPADAPLGYYDVNLSNSLDESLSILNGFIIAPITTDVPNKSIQSITVYPNPVTDVLNISGVKANGLLTISDLNGRTWLTKQVIDNTNISVCTLSKGLYILKLITKDGITTKKIIKK